MEHNTFELQISAMDNVKIGLYYGNKDNQVVDLKIFTPAECQTLIPHCSAGDGFVQILTASAHFMALNLIPADTTKESMKATVSYRLINH